MKQKQATEHAPQKSRKKWKVIRLHQNIFYAHNTISRGELNK
jgi:hypothetical protein